MPTLTEIRIKTALDIFNEKLRAAKNSTLFKGLKKDYIFSNYLTVAIQSTEYMEISNWIIKALVENTEDVLLITKDSLYNTFKSFQSALYTELDEAHFDAIQNRIYKVSDLPIKPYESKGPYKVYVLGLHEAQFKQYFFLTLSNKFKDTSCILGFN